MTKEEAEKLKLCQIVRCNITPKECTDEHKWCLPYCNKLAIVTQKIIWDTAEEIHLMFPTKIFFNQTNQYDTAEELLQTNLYDTVEELIAEFNDGHNISFIDGFDVGCEIIDWLDYEEVG